MRLFWRLGTPRTRSSESMADSDKLAAILAKKKAARAAAAATSEAPASGGSSASTPASHSRQNSYNFGLASHQLAARLRVSPRAMLPCSSCARRGAAGRERDYSLSCLQQGLRPQWDGRGCAGASCEFLTSGMLADDDDNSAAMGSMNIGGGAGSFGGTAQARARPAKASADRPRARTAPSFLIYRAHEHANADICSALTEPGRFACRIVCGRAWSMSTPRK